MPERLGQIRRRPEGRGISPRLTWLAVVIVAVSVLTVGCYNNNTGETRIGGRINFTLPAFPETGSNAVQVFTEMHYQPSFRSQEGPRLGPPVGSVPITGAEVRYDTLDEYAALTVQDSSVEAGEALFSTNCQVCHGQSLTGDGPFLKFEPRPPLPADLTLEVTRSAADGELFAFISCGGRQGCASRLRGRESASPMPEFQRLLTENERWALVQFLRSRIGR